MPEDTDLLDEQDVARLLENQRHLFDHVHPEDGAARIHVHGALKAQRIEAYLREAYGQLADTKSEAGAHGQSLLEMIDDAAQLRAHHLDKLDRLTA